MMETENVKIEVEADTKKASRSLRILNQAAADFGSGLSGALQEVILNGQELDDVFKNLALSVSNKALTAGLEPLQEITSQILQDVIAIATGTRQKNGPGNDAARPNLVGGLLGALTGAITGRGEPSPLPFTVPKPAIVPFARGGVVAAPSFFPLNSGFGVAGEAGAEAILPLRRGADGRLGVATPGAGGMSVTVNISTPDVTGFRQSEAQVTTALARAVARAQRAN